MNRLPTQPDTKPTTLFNPDREEFVYPYNGGKETYKLHAFSFDSFPAYIARKMASQLADKIIGKQGVKQNHTLDKKELLERILVKYEY